MNYARTIVVAALTVSCVSALTAACNNGSDGGSQAQSLENFAAGKVLRQNVCKGDTHTIEPKDLYEVPVFVVVDGVQKSTDLETVTRFSLSAVPYDLKKLFMIAGGKIFITNAADAAKACGDQRVVSTGSDQLGAGRTVSCIHDVTDKASPVSGLTMIMSDSPSYVAHILVRNFGYMMSQYFAWRYMATDKTGAIKTANPLHFDELRDALTLAFLQDVAGSKVFSLKRLEPLLGTDAEAIVRGNLTQIAQGRKVDPLTGLKWNQDPTLQLKPLLQKNAESDFKDYVLGETFDSYYCDAADAYDPAVAARIKAGGALSEFAALKDTRKVLHDFFPRSETAFLPIRDHFLQLARAARNSFNVALGLKQLPQPEHRYGDGAENELTARAAAGLNLAGPSAQPQLTQTQRTQIDRQVTSSPSYLGAQQRISDLQAKKDGAWVGGGYRYDQQIQQAQFDAAKMRNELFAQQSSKVLSTPENPVTVKPSYQGGPLEDTRKAYNQELDKQLDQSNQNLKAYVQSGTDLAKEQGDRLIAYGNSSENPAVAALAAGSGKLFQDTARVSGRVTNAISDGLNTTAKGIGKSDQVAVDGLNNSADFISDVQKASATARANGGDTLDSLAAGATAVQQKAINGLADASFKAEAEFGRMKTAYGDAQTAITDKAVDLTNKGYDYRAAALLAGGEKLDKVSNVLPTPLNGISSLPTALISNEVRGTRLLTEGDSTGAQDAFTDAAVQGGSNIVQGGIMKDAKDAAGNAAYDIFTSKAGPLADQRRNLAAAFINTGRSVDDALGQQHASTKDAYLGMPQEQTTWLDNAVTGLGHTTYDAATSKVQAAVVSAPGQIFNKVTSYQSPTGLPAAGPGPGNLPVAAAITPELTPSEFVGPPALPPTEGVSGSPAAAAVVPEVAGPPAAAAAELPPE